MWRDFEDSSVAASLSCSVVLKYSTLGIMFLTYLKPFVKFFLKLYFVIILCHCDNCAKR